MMALAVRGEDAGGLSSAYEEGRRRPGISGKNSTGDGVGGDDDDIDADAAAAISEMYESLLTLKTYS
jgi:hypothetical protein